MEEREASQHWDEWLHALATVAMLAAMLVWAL
jgi:hypothetical protein